VLWLAGILLIALGGLAAYWFATTVDHTQSVLALARPVKAGQPITAADLTTMSISAGPASDAIPATDAGSVIGKYATVPLQPGQILLPTTIAAVLDVPAGQALVGVAVTPAQAPSQQLQRGDRITIVGTPNAADDPPDTAPTGIDAIVISTQTIADTDKTVINVVVPNQQAALLAARAATGRIAIVVLSAGATKAAG
jgi:hypothetical protein